MIEQPHQPSLPTCLLPDSAGEWREPLDVRDLATRLETDGVTDSVAASEFGHTSAYSMAEAWLPRVLTYGETLEPPLPQRGWLEEYMDGIAFSIPLLFSCISILSLGFALWGGDLPNDEATAVGIGTIGSFLLSGGVVQAMVRRGLFFHTTQQPAMCASAIRNWLAVGVGVVGCGAAVLLAASSYWSWLPLRVNSIAAAFCVALGVFWLTSGAMYVLRKGRLLVGLNVAGIALVWLLHSCLLLPLIAAQLLALAACCVAALFVILRLLGRMAGSLQTNSQSWELAREAYIVWPFLIYGFLYYILLFGDRLAAWTAETYAAPLAVQFRGDYETAINVGLFMFVVVAGWVHCATAAFYGVITRSLRKHYVTHAQGFRADVFQFYKRYAAVLAGLGCGVGLVTLWGGGMAGLLDDQATRELAAWSMAGYILLLLGLWNVNLLFGLSSPVAAVRSAAIAAFADLAVGYALSRLGGYEYAVLGFFAGGAVFAAVSAYYLMQAFRELDYRQFAVTG